MYKVILLQIFLGLAVFTVAAQQPSGVKKDTTHYEKPTDTVKYVNVGKIAGRRAAIRSAMLPGLGQIRNGVTVYRLAKVAGIYTGFTLLTLSYIDNSKNYNSFQKELEYRANNKENPGQPDPNSVYRTYSTAGIISAKDIYRRNKQVIILSYGGLYLLNIVEAYIDARLANFDVGDVASFKVSPTVIPPVQMYGFNGISPGIKLTLSL